MIVRKATGGEQKRDRKRNGEMTSSYLLGEREK